MTIQDSNAERRNLCLLSLAIIIFYLGDGKLTDEIVRFQVVNIQFDRPEILVYFVWVLILWFALRYWQTHRHKPKQSFKEDIESISNSKLMILYAKKEFNLPYNEIHGFNAVSLSILNSKWRIRCQRVLDADLDEQGKFKVIKGTDWTESKEITGIKGSALKILLRLHAIATKPGVSAYTVPYVLFFMALLMPLIEVLKGKF